MKYDTRLHWIRLKFEASNLVDLISTIWIPCWVDFCFSSFAFDQFSSSSFNLMANLWTAAEKMRHPCVEATDEHLFSILWFIRRFPLRTDLYQNRTLATRLAAHTARMLFIGLTSVFPSTSYIHFPISISLFKPVDNCWARLLYRSTSNIFTHQTPHHQSTCM